MDRDELERIIATTEEAAASPRLARQRLGHVGREGNASANLLHALRHLEGRNDGLDRLREEHDAELRRVLAESRRRSVEGAAEAWKRMDGLARRERSAWELLPDDPWKPWSDILLSVLFVRAWPTAGNLKDSHLASGVNYAKYRVANDGLEKLSFYILWQNPRDEWVEADILVRLAAYGHGEVHADGAGVGSWFGLAQRSEAQVSAQLTIWKMWTSPAVINTVDSVPIATFTASAGFFGDSAEGAINQAPVVSTTSFAVAPAGVIVIEASVVVDSSGLGSSDIDFASGMGSTGFSIGVPYAVVTLPPATHP